MKQKTDRKLPKHARRVVRKKVRTTSRRGAAKKEKNGQQVVEPLLKLVWENSSDGMYISDEQGIIRDVNTAYCGIVKRKREELIGRHIADAFDESCRSTLMAEYQRNGYSDYSAFSTEKKCKLFFGEEIWLRARQYVLEENGYRELLTVVTDVTDFKLNEDILVEVENRSRAILSALPDMLFRLSEDGTIVDILSGAIKDLPLPPHEFLRKNLRDILPPTTAEQALKGLKTARLTGRSLSGEVSLPNPEGGINHYAARISPMGKGDILALVRNISEQKQSQEQILMNEERYRTLFNENLSGAFVTSIDGRFVAVNPAFAKMFGYDSVEEALKSNVFVHYAARGDRNIFLEELKKKKRLENFKEVLIRKDGMPLHILETVIGVFNEAGDLVELQGFALDETQHKLLENQLLQAQKMESIGTLAGGIAHDFNNVLAMIQTAAEMIGKRAEGNEKIVRYAGIITESAQRGAAIAKQLLLFSRSGEVPYQQVCVSDVMEEVAKLLVYTLPKSVSIVKEFTDERGVVNGNAGHLQQAILNLTINANDAMPQGGVLLLRVKTLDQNDVLNFYPDAKATRYVALTVADTGMGMDEATKKRIFDPFFSTKARGKGTGLGLSIVHGIVKSHGGHIHVESEPGKGSVFTIFLPAFKGEPSVERESTEQKILSGTETILVVDDEAVLQEVIGDLLKVNGYTVLIAKDGAEALEIYQQRKSEIALVLTDLDMPILGGTELTKRLRVLDPSVKIVVSTGYLDESGKQQMIANGANDLVSKPFKAQEVLQSIRTILDRR